MAIRTIGVVIDGATGRLGSTQHLKALLAMRAEGGLPLANGDCLVPEPLLLGPSRGLPECSIPGELQGRLVGTTHKKPPAGCRVSSQLSNIVRAS